MQELIFAKIQKTKIPIFPLVFLRVFPCKNKSTILERKMASNQKVQKTKIAQHKILQKKTSEPNLEDDFSSFFIFLTPPTVGFSQKLNLMLSPIYHISVSRVGSLLDSNIVCSSPVNSRKCTSEPHMMKKTARYKSTQGR